MVSNSTKKLIDLLSMAAVRFDSIRGPIWSSYESGSELADFLRGCIDAILEEKLTLSQKKELWGLFAPTCDWDDVVGDPLLGNQIFEFLKSMFFNDIHATEAPKAEEGLWCIVANIRREHPVGPGGAEVRIGTRQFRGGTKVYIAGCFPGTCDGVVCIGLHRKTRRFIVCVVNVKRVENFRVKLVYQPKVRELIERDDRCWIRTKDEAETWASAFPEWQKL